MWNRRYSQGAVSIKFTALLNLRIRLCLPLFHKGINVKWYLKVFGRLYESERMVQTWFLQSYYIYYCSLDIVIVLNIQVQQDECRVL